jgi:hypothetical protein
MLLKLFLSVKVLFHCFYCVKNYISFLKTSVHNVHNVHHLQNMCGTKKYDQKIKVRVTKSQKVQNLRNVITFNHLTFETPSKAKKYKLQDHSFSKQDFYHIMKNLPEEASTLSMHCRYLTCWHLLH